MGCQIPVMDGYQASEQVRLGAGGDSNKHIPIIAMTANAMMGNKEKCLASGISDYFTKPIDPQKIATKLKKYPTKKTDT